MSRVYRSGAGIGRLATVVAMAAWLLTPDQAVGVGQAQAPAPAPAPQEPGAQQPLVFREGVEFVSVDVFPRRDGKFVEGLTAADFQVFEDGTPQKVESFEFVRIDPNPPDGERRDPTSQADGDRQAADPRNRVWVVYLDLANTTIGGGYQARQPVVDFLRRTIGARDLFGVMTAETPASGLVFGRRLESIEGELENYWTWGQVDRIAVVARTPYEERISNCAMYAGANSVAIERLLITLSRQDQLMNSLENLMQRLGGLRDERKNVLFISEGWVPRGPRDELRNLNISNGSLPQVGTGPGGRLGLGQTQSPDTGDLTWCDTEVSRLGGMDFEHRFRQFLTTARQANVSFYPVDVGGLRTVAPLGGAVDTLRTLAENTDGFAIVATNDLTGGVRRIENDLSAFYLLGYYSSNPATNGRYRSIEVKVTVPDVRVSARRGYFAMTAEMAAAAAAARSSSGPTAVDAALGRLGAARADSDLFVAGTAGATGLDVSVEVAAEAVKREGWSQGTALDVTTTSADGRTATTTAQLAAGERNVRVSLPAAEVGSGPWRVTVQAAGRVGKVEQQTDIPAAVAAQLVGQPQAFRATPSPRSPLRPLADTRLSRLERLRVEWPILGEADAHTARLLDRSGKPLGQPLPFTPLPADRQALAIDLPMGALPEGDYVVELVATRAGESERRLLAFRVVR
jgi:VWFA-related protein